MYSTLLLSVVTFLCNSKHMGASCFYLTVTWYPLINTPPTTASHHGHLQVDILLPPSSSRDTCICSQLCSCFLLLSMLLGMVSCPAWL